MVKNFTTEWSKKLWQICNYQIIDFPLAKRNKKKNIFDYQIFAFFWNSLEIENYNLIYLFTFLLKSFICLLFYWNHLFIYFFIYLLVFLLTCLFIYLFTLISNNSVLDSIWNASLSKIVIQISFNIVLNWIKHVTF